MVENSAEKFLSSGGNISSYSDSELICTAGKKQKEARYNRAWIWEGNDTTWYSPIDYKSKPVESMQRENEDISYLERLNFFVGSNSYRQNGKNEFQGMMEEKKSSTEVMENTAKPICYPQGGRNRQEHLLFTLSNEAIAEAKRLGWEKVQSEKNRSAIHEDNKKIGKAHSGAGGRRGKIQTRYDKLSEEQKAGLEFLAEVAEKELKKIRDDGVPLEELDEGNKENQKGSGGSMLLERRALRKRPSYSEEIGSKLIKNFSDLNDQLFVTVEADGGYEYMCPKTGCGKTFPSLSRIKRHYIIHTGAKPFGCLNAQCPKRFSRKDNMLQHYKTHCKFS